jgi:phage tail sheath protein FI
MPPVPLTYPGVYVVEERSSVHTISGVPTSVAAFVGAAPRGPINSPVHVTSWLDYERNFGGLDTAVPLSYAVYLFFLNGGYAAEIVRADGIIDVKKVSHAAATASLQLDAVLQLPDPDAKLVATNVTMTFEASSPGEWGNSLEVTLNREQVGPQAFNITVTDPGKRIESYPRVTLDGPNKLSDAIKTSTLVRLQPQVTRTKAEHPPAKDAHDEAPIEATKPKSAVGKDAPAEAALLDIEAGWLALKSANIFNMLCLPTKPIQTYPAARLSEAAKFCHDHRAVLIVDTPSTWPLQGLPTFEQVTQEAPAIVGDDLSSSAIYYPNLVVTDRSSRAQISVGPSGAVAGVWARTDSERGVWKAPAGTQAAINGIDNIDARLTDSDIGVLNPLAVNCLKSIPFSGPVVWGSRTAAGADDSPETQWRYLPVRRTAFFIGESLRRGTQWAVFEPNDEPLWGSLRLNIGAFMHSLFRQGAFQGSTPSDAYFVKCDAENNPQNDIDRGILNILVGFAPLKPAEFVIIHIEQLAGQLQT